MTETSIGQRIATLRRYTRRGSARALAEATLNPKITESVIQNIESGRKKDLSVSQLIDISYALGVAPYVLLTQVNLPEQAVDLVNLGEATRELTSRKLGKFLREGRDADDSSSPAYFYNYVAELIESLREAQHLYPEYKELADQHLELIEYETSEGHTALHDPNEGNQYALSVLRSRMDTAYNRLKEIGSVDLSWVDLTWQSDKFVEPGVVTDDNFDVDY